MGAQPLTGDSKLQLVLHTMYCMCHIVGPKKRMHRMYVLFGTFGRTALHNIEVQFRMQMDLEGNGRSTIRHVVKPLDWKLSWTGPTIHIYMLVHNQLCFQLVRDQLCRFQTFSVGMPCVISANYLSKNDSTEEGFVNISG